MMSKNWLLIPAIMAAGLFTLKPATAQTCSPPPSGMVGWWPGDGNANDIIGGNNGTFIGSTGSVTFVPGEVLQALSFNGTGFVQVQPPKRDPTNIKGDLTIEAWINPATAIRGDIVVHGSGDDHVGAYTFRYGDGNDQKLLVSVSDGGTAESDYETSSSAI